MNKNSLFVIIGIMIVQACNATIQDLPEKDAQFLMKKMERYSKALGTFWGVTAIGSFATNKFLKVISRRSYSPRTIIRSHMVAKHLKRFGCVGAVSLASFFSARLTNHIGNELKYNGYDNAGTIVSRAGIISAIPAIAIIFIPASILALSAYVKYKKEEENL